MGARAAEWLQGDGRHAGLRLLPRGLISVRLFFYFISKEQSQVLQCRVWCINGINRIVDVLAASQFDLASLVSKE